MISKGAAIVSKPGKPELAGILPKLIAWLTAHKYKIIVDAETAALAPKQELVLRENMAARGVNLTIVLGGDGTLLSAARSLAAAGIPVATVTFR